MATILIKDVCRACLSWAASSWQPSKRRRWRGQRNYGCCRRRLVEGATENAATVQALIDNLIERGLDPALPRLFIIDGSKALSKAFLRPPPPSLLWYPFSWRDLHQRDNADSVG